MTRSARNRQGFTLIELSIALVIIGLIIGGILVGQEMIGAAYTRAQITQIEKYNTAANTFKIKYGYIPGDIPDPYASQFGFQARGQYAGEGDGNGVIEGISADAPSSNAGYFEGGGETAVFWVDLSTAGMLDASLTTATTTTAVHGAYSYQAPYVSLYIPPAKIGNGASVAVWSRSSINYFAVQGVLQIASNLTYASTPQPLTVARAYNIDKKIDDGLPTSGRVTAELLSGTATGMAWGAGYPYIDQGISSLLSTPVAVAGSSSTCFDNGNTNTVNFVYSMEQSNGSGPNCALSFRMQGAAR